MSSNPNQDTTAKIFPDCQLFSSFEYVYYEKRGFIKRLLAGLWLARPMWFRPGPQVYCDSCCSLVKNLFCKIEDPSNRYAFCKVGQDYGTDITPEYIASFIEKNIGCDIKITMRSDELEVLQRALKQNKDHGNGHCLSVEQIQDLSFSVVSSNVSYLHRDYDGHGFVCSACRLVQRAEISTGVRSYPDGETRQVADSTERLGKIILDNMKRVKDLSFIEITSEDEECARHAVNSSGEGISFDSSSIGNVMWSILNIKKALHK